MSYDDGRVNKVLTFYSDLVVDLLAEIERLNEKLLAGDDEQECDCEDCSPCFPPEVTRIPPGAVSWYEFDGEQMARDAGAEVCGCGAVTYGDNVIYSHCPGGRDTCKYCDRHDYMVHYKGSTQAALAYADGMMKILTGRGEALEDADIPTVNVVRITEDPGSEA